MRRLQATLQNSVLQAGQLGIQAIVYMCCVGGTINNCKQPDYQLASYSLMSSRHVRELLFAVQKMANYAIAISSGLSILSSCVGFRAATCFSACCNHATAVVMLATLFPNSSMSADFPVLCPPQPAPPCSTTSCPHAPAHTDDYSVKYSPHCHTQST